MKFQEFMNKSDLMGLYGSYQNHFLPLIQELKNKGCNLNESLILLALFFEPRQQATPTQLQECLFIPKDRISQSLKSLEKSKWIQRSLGEKDRRLRVVTLEKSAKKLCTDLIESFETHEQRLESKLIPPQ